jgi:hypothetical protein
MFKRYLKTISFVFILMIFTVAIGCSSNRQVIHSVPLCDCEPGSETTRDKYHKEYVCDANATCVPHLGHKGKLVIARN